MSKRTKIVLHVALVVVPILLVLGGVLPVTFLTGGLSPLVLIAGIAGFMLVALLAGFAVGLVKARGR